MAGVQAMRQLLRELTAARQERDKYKEAIDKLAATWAEFAGSFLAGGFDGAGKSAESFLRLACDIAKDFQARIDEDFIADPLTEVLG